MFDGIACGRVALERAGIPINRYIASEIEPNAIRVSMTNWSDIEQIGDVVAVQTKTLPEIDLLIGGSPCQGFSASGKGLNFVDPRSRLFFEYVRILKETKPKYFILENVKMKKEWSDIITEPDDYVNMIPETQARKALGNAWTVDVIAHILSGIKKEGDLV